MAFDLLGEVLIDCLPYRIFDEFAPNLGRGGSVLHDEASNAMNGPRGVVVTASLARCTLVEDWFEQVLDKFDPSSFKPVSHLSEYSIGGADR